MPGPYLAVNHEFYFNEIRSKLTERQSVLCSAIIDAIINNRPAEKRAELKARRDELEDIISQFDKEFLPPMTTEEPS